MKSIVQDKTLASWSVNIGAFTLLSTCRGSYRKTLDPTFLLPSPTSLAGWPSGLPRSQDVFISHMKCQGKQCSRVNWRVAPGWQVGWQNVLLGGVLLRDTSPLIMGGLSPHCGNLDSLPLFQSKLSE